MSARSTPRMVSPGGIPNSLGPDPIPLSLSCLWRPYHVANTAAAPRSLEVPPKVAASRYWTSRVAEPIPVRGISL